MWRDRLRLLVKTYLQIQVASVPGDVVECGVGKGKSLAVLAQLVAIEKKGRQLWAFESWDVFPPLAPEDTATDGNVAYLTEGLVVGNKEVVGVRLGPLGDSVRFVDGYLADTLPAWCGGPVAYLHLDLDLYVSYRTALLHLWPKLSTGGIAVFDEYHEKVKYPGVKKAVDEFLRTVPHTLHEDTRWYAVKS